MFIGKLSYNLNLLNKSFLMLNISVLASDNRLYLYLMTSSLIDSFATASFATFNKYGGSTTNKINNVESSDVPNVYNITLLNTLLTIWSISSIGSLNPFLSRALLIRVLTLSLLYKLLNAFIISPNFNKIHTSNYKIVSGVTAMRKQFPKGSIAHAQKVLNVTHQTINYHLRNGDQKTVDVLEKIIQDMAENRKKNIQRAEALKQIIPLSSESSRRKDAVDN